MRDRPVGHIGPVAHEFAVWAPDRTSVGLVLGGPDRRTEPMTAGTDGWWHASVPEAGPGTDYAFSLDGGDPLPDPRSRWQPHGVHAASRLVEVEPSPADAAWTGRSLPGAVIYEMHVGTFTPEGTFASAEERLDHLVELGVDFVEVLPVNAFDGTRGWGYDGVLWYAVTENYGGPAAFRRFVDACHARGLGVVLDVVYNHLGPSGAYLDRFGPYFLGENVWGPSLNLDGPGSDTVRAYILDNVTMWLRDYGVDALRLDAVHALRDARATHLLEEMADHVASLSAHLRRPLTLIAESDLNDPRLITSREAGGYGLDAQWCDDVHHALHSTLTGETQGYYVDFGDLATLAEVLHHPFHHAGTWSTFRGRVHGRPVDLLRTPGHRFLAYLQDHDQVGNRAGGDRLSATLSPGLLGCGAALVFCSPYTPMLFMGEEWGARTPWAFFVGFSDPELQVAVREGRTKEFAEHGWGAEEVPDPTAEATFEASKLDWSEPSREPHAALLGVYRELIALRRAHPELTDPHLAPVRVDHDAQARTLVVHRGTLRLAVNLGGSPATLPVAAREVLSAPSGVDVADASLTLPAEAFALVRVR
ncbi:malto-oligosyltrehalose trehalohydrolase [Actinomycetospora straminea]|uniref:Malto-oligosyltrehalose trehalohydrolase n=1 Tax=Actinomycetospora straminea TaxID=663607 RepID=A0ABP9DZN9_9PSEU|nr:malto-oligosyltrehalose trehalohydrolase [Actinomycetospora straminea]MDD7932268.1 malto-oligosyltrehalose trehalohydrolase [Actinomycetospora straminea]